MKEIKKPEAAETESLLNETRSLSEKAHKILPPTMAESEKRNAILMASYEKMLAELVSQDFELRVIQDSLYYYWFFLEAPLHGAHPSWVREEDPWSHMEAIMNVVIETVDRLPEPDLPDEILALNDKMQQLKACLPSPEEIDRVSADKISKQSDKVDPVIHGLTCAFLKQRMPIDEITNVMFYHLLRICTLSGFTEHEWQKINYYLPTITANVRLYFKKKAEAKLGSLH